MVSLGRSLALGLSVAVVAGCSTAAKPSADTTTVAAAPAATANSAADETAIRDLNASWFKIYNTHDAAALAALYADDAVLMMPGKQAIRGRDAIKAAYQKDMDEMAKAGNMNNQGSDSEAGVSGDVAWESNTFDITDKTGKKIDAGKYVTVFARKDGKWAIIRDIWNSDSGTATP
ncbi:MAG: YybH family protein [Gemmatimonas sp.]